MKKICYLPLTLLAAATLFAGCKRDQEEPDKPDVNTVGTFTQTQLIDAFSAMYEAWMESTTLPATLSVGGKELTAPQYQYALCKLLVNLKAGKSEAIDVLSYKAADHPDRDSYDKETIAVVNGPSNAVEAGATEDLADIARRMLAVMAEKGQVPNQTIFMRSEAIAFSTNRATVSMARAIAAYKSDGRLPGEVSTEYLSASATLKGFAQQFISYLDVWQRTIGTVSADGSHCSDNNSAWQNVHFIPIPHSGGVYADGKDQYAPEFQPYHTIEVAGVRYDAAQCFVIAAKGFLDLVTKEGSAVKQTERNTPVHTLANGKGLSEPIPAVDGWAAWGSYPWYEKSDDPCAINLSAEAPCNLAFMMRTVSWFLTRAEALAHIGNFIAYGDDPDKAIVCAPYQGNISPMRTLLILARFYKHLLDNRINDKVYDAMKDVNLDYDLYGVELPDIELQTQEVSAKADGQTVDATFVAKKDWTATPSDSWIAVDPASGAPASPVTLKITAAPNSGAAREGTVVIKGGNITEGLAIKVTQEAYVAPSGATLKDFAQAFVKALDVWNATVGTVDANGIHCTANGNAWENVHFIPIGETTGNPYGTDGNQYDPKYTVWKLDIKGVEYTSAQAWEIAIRGLVSMTTAEGEPGLANMTDRNQAFTLQDNAGLGAAMPSATAGCIWGVYPWYEGDANGAHTVTYQGEALSEVGLDFVLKCCTWHVVRSFVKNAGNNPLGKIGNYQEFGTASNTLILDGYEGQICPMRELLILARIYKSLLDNHVEDKVYTFLKDRKFDFDLFNQGAPVIEGNTIKAFAQQYVTLLDAWNNNTGEVTPAGANYVQRGRMVPNSFTIPFNGETLSKAKMNDVAMQALQVLFNGGSLSDPAPAGRTDIWPPNPFVEGQPGNMPFTCSLEGFSREQAEYTLINAISKSQADRIGKNSGDSKRCANFYNMDSAGISGYSGFCCTERFNLIFARTFKYLLDNDITSDVAGRLANVKIDATLL